MEASLNKNERKFLSDFLKGWKISPVGSSGSFAWFGDPMCPVKVGSTINSLKSKGLVEDLGSEIRSLKIAETYRCNARFCQSGTIETYNEEQDEWVNKGACPKCDGIGVLKEPKNFTNK